MPLYDFQCECGFKQERIVSRESSGDSETLIMKFALAGVQDESRGQND